MAFIGDEIQNYEFNNIIQESQVPCALEVYNNNNIQIILYVFGLVYYAHSVYKTYYLLELEQYGLRQFKLILYLNRNKVSRIIIASIYLIIDTYNLLSSVTRLAYYLIIYLLHALPLADFTTPNLNTEYAQTNTDIEQAPNLDTNNMNIKDAEISIQIEDE